MVHEDLIRFRAAMCGGIRIGGHFSIQRGNVADDSEQGVETLDASHYGQDELLFVMPGEPKTRFLYSGGSEKLVGDLMK